MTAPSAMPCGWDLSAQPIPHWADATPEQQVTAAAVGVYVVWALSGRRYGVCQEVLRPPAAARYLACVPAPPDSLLLPGPVVAVDEVKIDGVVVPPAEYMLFGGTLFGTAPWPVDQDMALPDTELGTWSVTYQRGIPVPGAGLWAAAALTGEVLLGTLDLPGARIPWRVQSISREGVSMQMLDPGLFLDGGKTGVPEVDMFLASANPHKLSAAPAVWSPDFDPSGTGPRPQPSVDDYGPFRYPGGYLL